MVPKPRDAAVSKGEKSQTAAPYTVDLILYMIPRISIVCGLAFVLAGCDATSKKSAAQALAAGEAEAAAVVLPAQVSFNEHIQPILSEYCYHCHGPDSKTREPKDAPLRLDRVEDAFV